MIRALLVLASMLIVALAGCGAQGVLLGTESGYLLTAADSLCLPGQEVQLQAKLQGGDLLKAQPGYVIRFYRDGRLFKAAQTGADGTAGVSFKPDGPGDYKFKVDVSPAGFSDPPPGSQELLVACRQADQPMVVVDLDRTVVASGFHMVLLGDPEPMPGSAELLGKLAKTYSIVYLTHRPDYFGPKSKAWLAAHGYPRGPVLLAGVSGFLKGSGQFKSEMLAEMKKSFSGIEMGIGDKVSDAAAYWRNGLKSFLIIQVPESDDPAVYENLADSIATLSDDVQVVTSWQQIDSAIFAGASFPRSLAEGELRNKAEALKAQHETDRGSSPRPATRPGGSR